MAMSEANDPLVTDHELTERSVPRFFHELIPICRQSDLLDRHPHAASQRLHLVSIRVPTDDDLEFPTRDGRGGQDFFPSRESRIPWRQFSLLGTGCPQGPRELIFEGSQHPAK